MISIVVILLILSCPLFAQCSFSANQSVSLASGLACFRSLSLNQPYQEFTSTINLVKTYLNSYAFKDTSLYPNANGTGYDQPSVDIFGSLDEIGQTAFNNTFDFYESIMVLLNKLKDAHTYFVPPCIQKFSYVLPYVFSIYQNSDLTQSVRMHYVFPSARQKYLSEGGVDIRDNAEFLHINLKGKPIYTDKSELNDGTYLASEAIAHWADEEVSTARSSITRLNFAATGEFSLRPVAYYPHPEYENITVEYINPGGSVFTARLPFYVYQGSQISSFTSECPVSASGMNKNEEEKQNPSVFKRILNWIIGKINNQQQQTTSITYSVEELQMMQKHKEQQEQIVTQHIQERIRPKFLEEISKLPILPVNNSNSINNNKPQLIRIQSDAASNDGTAQYFLQNSQTGIIQIQTFSPSSTQQFQQEIYQAISNFKNENSTQFAKRIIIDVRSNPGGYIYLGAQTLRFLFPQAGHPIYPVVDQIRTPLNKEYAVLEDYIQRNQMSSAELMVNPENMSVDSQFYTRGGRNRKTTSNEFDKSMEVELTEKYGIYRNQVNRYITLTTNQKWKRQILYNPEDVLIITDGQCASTCSQFLKAIQQKHLARIISVGVKDPRDPNKRQDISYASSGSATNVNSIQSDKSYANYRTIWNTSNIPGKFVRTGTYLGFANRGLYGYNDQSKDQLMEYQIIDPDFRYEVAPNPGETPEYLGEAQKLEFYENILNIESELLGNQQTQQEKKCLSWEVDFVQAASNGDCRGCLRGDQHSVFGYPCTTRGKTEQEGRNIDGTSKIGVFDDEQCVFSHCKVGYYRKNVNVNGTMKDQCVLIPLGYNETRSEMTPDQSEDEISVDDQCGNPCKNITSATPIDTCACPTDPTKLQQDPRKDGLCKCAIITSSTPIDQCACPTDANLLALDPRKDGLCKCAIIVQTTPIDTCACPTERSELDKDPRKDGLCKCAIITSTTPIDTCACPTDSNLLALDPRKEGLCKCAIITSSTPVNTCPCPTDPTKLQQDPRKDGLCKCAIITSTTPIDTCPCPTDSNKLAQDPRKDGLCKCSIITSTTPIDTCPCPTDSNLLAQDPRKDGLCQCAIITSSTPVNTCPCPTDSNLLAQDPRKDGLCKCAIITSSTPIDQCACPTDANLLALDPRKDGLCKCAIIVQTTPIDTCACPTERSELDKDPRKDGLCKCAIITSTTPIDTCACPTDSNLLALDPRKEGLCKCAIITSSTPVSTCPCPTDQSKLQQDPRKDGLCKCAIITSTTSPDTCPCPTELAKDPRQYGICQPEAKFFEYYINKSSGIDRLDRGLSPSSPTRSIGYTIKTLVDSYQYRGSALLNVAADNFSENIEFKSPGHGINTFRLVGTPKDGNNETYPALTNSAHPDQGAIKIIGVGVHVQHFIFAYVPPVSLVSTIQPMISINAGSLSDWNEIASGQRNEIPDHLTQTFTDCIFEGSSVDYNTKKSYGYTIGPFLSIIGTRVTIENCQFNTKDNIQILKGIPSAIISAVFLYPDSGIIINNCNFENLTQSSQVSEAALRETGILNLTGNNKAQQQHLNNLPPSLAIFGIVDSTSSNNSRNAETAQIEVKSTQFINSKGESARCEAVLIDGFALVRSFNDLKSSKSNQLKHKLNNASPLYLPIVNLDGNSFENANEQTNAFVALGSGVRYGLISNNRFVFNNTTSDKETVLINFESAERVTESGGAENIIGSGNTYTTSLIEEGGSDQIQTSGLFTVEGKQDSSFDIQTDSKVTVNIIDTTSDVVEEKDDDIKGKKSGLNSGAIVGIVFAVLIVIVLISVGIFFGIYMWKKNAKKNVTQQKNAKKNDTQQKNAMETDDQQTYSKKTDDQQTNSKKINKKQKNSKKTDKKQKKLKKKQKEMDEQVENGKSSQKKQSIESNQW